MKRKRFSEAQIFKILQELCTGQKTHFVFPAKAGIHSRTLSKPNQKWIPAFAGKTDFFF